MVMKNPQCQLWSRESESDGRVWVSSYPVYLSGVCVQAVLKLSERFLGVAINACSAANLDPDIRKADRAMRTCSGIFSEEKKEIQKGVHCPQFRGTGHPVESL